MTQTYKKLFDYPTLRLKTPIISEWMKNRSIPLTNTVIDKSCLVGIEVEIENLQKYFVPDILWQVTEDGSLRNYGREYISWPVRGNQVEYAVRYLFEGLRSYKYQFTKRCSIHVHMNARTMKPAQVMAMMLIYLVFEKNLFSFIGEDREKNIHCVPLHDSNITNLFSDILEGRRNPDNWMKYTAFNLCPLNSKGTIEFRHLHGTDDIDKIMNWINILLSIKMYAYRNSLEDVRREIFELNSNSNYRAFAHRVFGSLAPLVYTDNDAEAPKNMEEGVYMVKYNMNTSNFLTSLRMSPTNVKFLKAFGKSAPNKKAKISSNHSNPFLVFAEVMEMPVPASTLGGGDQSIMETSAVQPIIVPSW